MSLQSVIHEHVRACCTGLWIVTREPEEVLRDLRELCTQQKWKLYNWDAYQGSRGLIPGSDQITGAGPTSKGPQAAVMSLEALHYAPQSDPKLLTLSTIHRYLNLPDVVQGIANLLQMGKQSLTFAVVLAPTAQIPPELLTYFVRIEHELPTRDEIDTILASLDEETPSVPTTVLDAASGLTRYEVENAGSLSLIRHGTLDARELWSFKSQVLAKDGLLSLYRGNDRFTDLGGLQSVKDFCVRALTPRPGRKSVAKGIIALGVAGAGKSAFAKALGNETERPTVTVDIGSLLSKYVGESEERLRRVLATLEAMSPCVAFLDEIEKGLSGVGSGMDSGVMDRIFGNLLTWRQDTKAEVFLVATSNDVSKMPAPLLRAGRTNAIFFFDLPSQEERQKIWDIYLKHFEIPRPEKLPEDTDWTGAEIRNCCELGDLLGLSLDEAARMVIPISVTQQGQISELRAWAEGRALAASYAGYYHRSVSASTKLTKRRNINPNKGESLN